jgi:uncharacterized protein
MDWKAWEREFARFLADQLIAGDAAHDAAHIRRVVSNARAIAAAEGADLAVVLPAAWLHDCVSVPKDSPQRARASRLAAETAVAFLQQHGYPARYHDEIAHAITAHSFSARITPRTLAAQVVQDADRLDALGAIGIARTMVVGGALGRQLYDPADPFCAARPPDDGRYTLDHFYRKLFTLAATMQTAAGRREAERRTTYMRAYLQQLRWEITIFGTDSVDSSAAGN